MFRIKVLPPQRSRKMSRADLRVSQYHLLIMIDLCIIILIKRRIYEV